MSLISNKKRYLNSASLVYFCFLDSHVQAQTQLQNQFNRHTHELAACRDDNSNPSNCYKPLSIVNDRSEPVWISVIQSDLVLWHKKKIKSGQTVPFLNIPRNGISSLTFKVATGCDENGNNCLTGEVRGGLYDGRDPSKVYYDLKIDENGKETGDRIYRSAMFKDPPPSEHVNSVDFVTKAEFTFGCFNGNSEQCNKTPQNNFLPKYTNFNLSAVDGFNVPLKIVVTRSSDETQDQKSCPVLLDASHLSIKNCSMFRGHSLSVFTPDDLKKRDTDLKKGDTSHPIGCYSPNKLITTATIFGGLGQKEDDGMNYQYSCHTLFNHIPEGEKEDLAVIQCRYVYQGSDRRTKREEALKWHNEEHPKYWGHGKDWTKSVQGEYKQHAIYSFAYDDIAALKQCNSMETKYELHILDDPKEVEVPSQEEESSASQSGESDDTTTDPSMPPISPEVQTTPPIVEEGNTITKQTDGLKICTKALDEKGIVDLHYYFESQNKVTSGQLNVRMTAPSTDASLLRCYLIAKNQLDSNISQERKTLIHSFTKISGLGVGQPETEKKRFELVEAPAAGGGTTSGTLQWEADAQIPGLMVFHDKTAKKLKLCMRHDGTFQDIILHYNFSNAPSERYQDNQKLDLTKTESINGNTHACFTIDQNNLSPVFNSALDKSTVYYSFTTITTRGVGADSKWSSRTLK